MKKSMHFGKGLWGGALAAALLTATVAQASPTLLIVGSTQDALGDAGGSNVGGGGTTAGVGMPTVAGGWANPGNFDADSSSGNTLGITGYSREHGGPGGTIGGPGAYLQLSETARVTFQYLGSGDAAFHNKFQVDFGAGWTTLFTGGSGGTNSCGVSVGLAPIYNCAVGTNQFSYDMAPGSGGYLAFRYLIDGALGNPVTNDGIGNDGDANYFLGVDPYLTGVGSYARSGSAVFVGFTDGGLPGAPIDHDYADGTVRVSVTEVPEPGSLALAGIALCMLVPLRRRRKAVTACVE